MDLESVLQISNRYHHEGEDVALLHHWLVENWLSSESGAATTAPL